jgi:hypothetical protein
MGVEMWHGVPPVGQADAGHGWLHPRERLILIVLCIAGSDA